MKKTVTTNASGAGARRAAIGMAAASAIAIGAPGCAVDEPVHGASTSTTASASSATSGAGGANSGSTTAASTTGSAGGSETTATSSVTTTTGSGAGGAGGAGAGGAGGANGTVSVQLLAFNDFHGNLEPPAGSGGKITLPDMTQVTAGGAAFFAAHIKSLRAKNPNTLVVSAGDLIGASPLTSALFYDEPTINAMNLIGLDISAVGNHEFDKGSGELLRMQYGGCRPSGCVGGGFFSGASFRYLAANVDVGATGDKTLFPRYDIRTFEGVKIAFIGMTLEGTPLLVTPTGVAGLSFKDEVDTVNGLVPELQKQGVEAIVVVVHEGGYPTGGYDECPSISGAIVEIATKMSSAVDVILSGHTHQAYNCTIAGKLVTSAASFGRLVTTVDLTLDKATGHIVGKSAKNQIVTRDVPVDPTIDALVTSYKSMAAPLANKPVGTIAADLDRIVPMGGAGVFTLGEVIADAQLEATKPTANGGAQVSFMNSGGVRADLVYAAAPSEGMDGLVTYSEAFTVQPFGNTLTVLTLTGDQIKTMLEEQWTTLADQSVKAAILQPSAGFSYAYSASAPVGAKVDFASIKIGGVPIEHTTNYRVSVNSFLAAGGDGFVVLKDGGSPVGGLPDLDAFLAYFAAHSPVAPPPLDRVTILP